MPRVKGFLRILKRRPGHPDIGLPDEGEDMTPDWGIEEGGGDIDNELPTPPPGIWPPLTPEQPWRPIPDWPERPSTGLPPTRPPAQPGQPLPPSAGHLPAPPVLPPGTVWPPLPPTVHGKFLALVLIGATGHGAHYRYVVIDADAHPDQGLPEETPPREPKR